MAVVIIIGGSGARQAITDLENASITMSTEQRANATKLLQDFTKAANTFTLHPQPPA